MISPPVASPLPGTFNQQLTVLLSADADQIYFTTDGSDPVTPQIPIPIDTGNSTSACLIELDDHTLWAVIANSWRTYAASQGVAAPDFGFPANTCFTELPDRILRAITAYYASALSV